MTDQLSGGAGERQQGITISTAHELRSSGIRVDGAERGSIAAEHARIAPHEVARVRGREGAAAALWIAPSGPYMLTVLVNAAPAHELLCYFGSTRVLLGSAQVLMLPPSLPLDVSTHNGIDLTVLRIDLRRLPGGIHLDAAGLATLPGSRSLREVRALVEDILAGHAHEERRTRMKHTLEDWVIWIARAADPIRTDFSRTLVAKARLEILRSSADVALNSVELARRMAVSAGHLGHAFRQEGSTPYSEIRTVRALRAGAILERFPTTGRSGLAGRVGFGSSDALRRALHQTGRPEREASTRP